MIDKKTQTALCTKSLEPCLLVTHNKIFGWICVDSGIREINGEWWMVNSYQSGTHLNDCREVQGGGLFGWFAPVCACYVVISTYFPYYVVSKYCILSTSYDTCPYLQYSSVYTVLVHLSTVLVHLYTVLVQIS